MQQNIEDNKVLELQLLYYIHSEIISSEEIHKILWNKRIYNWEQLISQDYDVNIIGLYGIQQTVCEYLEKRLSNKLKLSEDALKHQRQSTICFINHKHTYYIAFIGLEEELMKDQFKENIDLSLFRYLKDLCSQIILLPSKKILDGWKSLEQVSNYEASSVVQQYRIQDIKHDLISYSEIDLRIDQQYIQIASKLLNGQGNIRAYYSKKKENFYLIDEQNLEKIFRKIWQGYKVSQLDFVSDYSINIQEILQQSAVKVSEWINQKKEKKQKKCEEALYFVRVSFQKEFQVQNICQVLFKSIWDNMPINNKLDQNNAKFKNILLHSVENVYPNQYEILKNNPRFVKSLELIINQQILVLNHFYKKKYRKDSMTIKDIYDEFISQVNQRILKQNSQQSDLEIQLFKYSSIISGEKKMFGTIEWISVRRFEIKQHFQVQNTEEICLVYYFRTQKSKQNMFVFQKQDKNNQYEYKWVVSQGDKNYKTIFTYKQQKNQLMFYYDNVNCKLYAFNCNNGISFLTFDEEKNVIIRDDSEICKDLQFSDCCYLSCFGCFMLLSNEKLFKWSSKNLELIKLSQPYAVRYDKIFSVGSGYFYALSDLNNFNILDFNHQLIASIQLQDFNIKITNKQQITLFAYQSDWFLCLINDQRQITIQIKNVNTQSQIIQDSIEEKQTKYSNPFLDIIKDSEEKFGLHQYLICTSQKTSELFVTKDVYEIIQEYFDHLQLHLTNHLIKNNCYQTEGLKVKINELVFVMISRIALQLCTIDQSVLVPLQTGLYRRNFIIVDQENTIDIIDKIEKMKFGIFEMIQHFSQFKIFIVSIMGKQSCGKSYLLNRIFGTRFGVSSARCTDGIQMSVSKIENTIFITLDCEGLFSQRRTSEEELMLLIFLTGLSDVTILNQDLNFNRNIDEVFTNLAGCSDNIQGDNLFKGKLMIAVRDVNQKEKEQAKNQLLENICNISNSQQKGNFLSSLFDGDFITIFMSHLENKSFESQVQDIRRTLIKLSLNKCKWTDYQQLLQTMKIMLVQLEVNDHRKIDDIIGEHNIRKLKNQAIFLWQQYQIGDIEGMNFANMDQTYQILQEFFIFKLTENQQKIGKMHHNDYLKQCELEIKKFLEQRVVLILKKLSQQFEELLKDNTQLRIDIEQSLNSFKIQFYFCDQKCFDCNLSCKQRMRHSNQQQIHYDTIQNDILNEKNKQNRLYSLLKNQNCYNKQQYKDLIQQINVNNKEISYLKLKKNKLITLVKLKDLLLMDLDELKIDDYMLKFLQSNFNVMNENNLSNCEQIIQDNQLSRSEELKNKQRLLSDLIGQYQKILEKQNKSNQQKQNIQLMQLKLQTQIIEVQKQIDLVKFKEQNLQNDSKQQIFENIEHLQPRLEQKRNYLKINLQKEKEIQNQLQLKTEEIMQRINDQEIDFLLEIELLPSIEKQVEELILNYNQESLRLKNLNKYLQKYQGNNKQLNQIKKINQDIEKIQNSLQINLQRQQCLKQQINVLRSAQEYKVSYDEISQIILENEQPELIRQKKELKSQIQVIQVDIYNLESECDQKYKNQQLINLEMKLQNYNSELQIIKQQQLLDDIEGKIQDTIELQDEINNLIKEIEQLNSINKKNENNIKLYQEINNQNNLLNDYNIQLNAFQNIILCGKDQQTLEMDVKKLNEQLQQIEKIYQLNQQLQQSEKIVCELEEQLINIKIQIKRSHNCGFFDHDCDQICQSCNKPDIFCKFQAGHQDHIHLCVNKQHFCEFKCKVKDCQNICSIEYGHKDDVAHKCQEYHQCHNKCDYSCKEYCSFNASDDHQVHQCQNKYCNHQCYFQKNCFAQIKCQNICSKQHNEIHDIHICQNQHQCNYTCDQPGICQIGNYTEKYTKKDTENGSFQFIIYEQNAQKRQCKFFIQSGMISHQGPHQCEKTTHLCNSRCPECNAYCDKLIGHQDKHSVHQHRNKEKQLFTQLAESKNDRVEIQEVGKESRIYRVGESCYPETCLKSCQRRDRAHFHLIPCPGSTNLGECLVNTLNNEKNQVARHQPKQYLGSNLIYDEILCNQYWEYQKWEHPVDIKFGQFIPLCNYYCYICDRELNVKYFCTQLAWHNDSNNYDAHKFSCAENHKFYGIDICFVIDSTQTMHSYADLIRKSIYKFKNASFIYQKDQNAIFYSIVSYTDHDDQQTRYKNECVNYIDFTNHQQAQQFVNNIIFEYSNDYCEAMLDGLQGFIIEMEIEIIKISLLNSRRSTTWKKQILQSIYNRLCIRQLSEWLPMWFERRFCFKKLK